MGFSPQESCVFLGPAVAGEAAEPVFRVSAQTAAQAPLIQAGLRWEVSRAGQAEDVSCQFLFIVVKYTDYKSDHFNHF